MLSTARRCCALNWTFPVAAARPATLAATVGAVTFSARPNRRASASSTAVEEYFSPCRGRNRLVPSSRWNRTGLVASSGGVRTTERDCAASTTRPMTASRSSVVANLRSMVCFDASAIRFQCVHTARFTDTAATTSALIASIAASGTSSAVSGFPPWPITSRDHADGSVPNRSAARCRQSAVRSASDRTSFGGRVASVAWARSSTMVFADGVRPWRAAYSAMSSSFLSSISRVRLENSVIRSSLTPAISHRAFRSGPRCRNSHSMPRSRDRRSASSAS